MYKVKPLPLTNIEQRETREVLKKVAKAHRFLAEVKGVAKGIPNEAILINTLSLQEAKDSSAVENIVTTHDEIYKSSLFDDNQINPAAKEVQDYAFALQNSFKTIRSSKIIRLNDILHVQELIEKNKAGLRKVPGTELKNSRTGEVVYTPPQHPDEIISLMQNLIEYINNDEICDADPLVKMAIIHHQFESIHPFYDGNGRTGRVLNLLYLASKDLLDLPVLYLSRYIINNKDEYYTQLQQVRETDSWEAWIIFILDSIIETSQHTAELISQIKTLMQQIKNTMRQELPKIYSQELLNNLFNHPYTKIEFVMNDLNISRTTATKYLDLLDKHRLVQKQKVGRTNYYINQSLCKILIDT